LEIKNDNGEVLAILNIGSLQKDDALNSIIRGLRPGMGKGIYLANEKKISQQTNYASIKWLDGLSEIQAKAPLWEPVFPKNAEVLEILVYYGFNNLTQDEIDEMAVESEKTGRNVVRDLVPNNTLVGVSLFCRLENTTFEFRIFGTTKSRIHVPDREQQTIENLTIRANEAVYVSDSKKHRLIWAEVGPNMGKALQYELSAEHSSRDWLISTAESLTRY
jgi:hypothetical protein